jgi:hypothetical protein
MIFWEEESLNDREKIFELMTVKKYLNSYLILTLAQQKKPTK